MKLLSLPVQVDAPRGRPQQIRWNDRVVRVRQLADFWVLQSRWWAREERRVYFRADTPRGLVELYRSGDAWTLSRIMD